MRCLIQFIGQAVGLMILHRRWGRERLPFRMWLYPLPVVISILGWIGIFFATGTHADAGLARSNGNWYSCIFGTRAIRAPVAI